MHDADAALTDADYGVLADFRFALRQFLAFSEKSAAAVGLTPQQHQMLLAIRGAPPGTATIGWVAARLMLKSHSASGLVDRLDAQGLVRREAAPDDRRRTILRLTARAHNLLGALSAAHRDQIRRLRPALADMLADIG